MSTPDADAEYATVTYSDHSLQYICTVTINIIATPVNFLTFYLILMKSKRERKSFKVVFFASQLFFYLAQFHLGVFMGLVNLQPFPAIYCQGIFKNVLSTFVLTLIWTILFSLYAYSIFVTLVIRLQIVARPGKLFDCRQLSYNIAYLIIALLVILPIPSLLALSYSSKEEMETLVYTKFPKNLKVLEIENVYIFTHLDKLWIAKLVSLLTVSLGFLFVVFMYSAITYEIKAHAKNKSTKNTASSMRSLHNLVVHSTTLSAFIGFSCILIIKTLFNDPSEDSRISNIVAFTCLCGASIPSQMTMIYRNTVYRRFVFRKRTSGLAPITVMSSTE